MNPSKYEFADESDHRHDVFDHELDAALASHANVNPRTGLEDRIMVRIGRTEKR